MPFRSPGFEPSGDGSALTLANQRLKNLQTASTHDCISAPDGNLRSAELRPRFGLKADIASGDRNLADQTLGTFNALFPKGAYFSEADLLGPYNLMDLHPSVELHLTKSLKLTPDADFFWRQSTHDGIYGIP